MNTVEKKVLKRSRHWDETETKVLIFKWSEENIQEQFKPCMRKKKIWDDVAVYVYI